MEYCILVKQATKGMSETYFKKLEEMLDVMYDVNWFPEKQAEQPSGYDTPLPTLTLAEAVMTPKSVPRSSSLDTSLDGEPLDGELMSPQVSAWSPVDPKVAAAMATAPVPQTSESSSFASILSTRGGLKALAEVSKPKKVKKKKKVNNIIIFNNI